MSDAPRTRRADKVMPEERTREVLQRGFCCRVANVGADGWPYVVPLLYLWMNGEIWVHNSAAPGHFRVNVDHDARVCFEVDEPGEVFPYGRFECDTSVEYRSVVVRGRIRIVENRESKQAFFEALMEKYGAVDQNRPRSFFPRLDDVTVYAISIEHMAGKETILPTVENRWPAIDNTKTPHVKP